MTALENKLTHISKEDIKLPGGFKHQYLSHTILIHNTLVPVCSNLSHLYYSLNVIVKSHCACSWLVSSPTIQFMSSLLDAL